MDEFVKDKSDEKFLQYMREVEERYQDFGRHERIRIEQWSKKLCQVTTNPAWKRNRNLYAMILTDCVLNGKLTKPFTQVPPDAHLPVLNKAEISSRFSAKFKAFQKTLSSLQFNKNTEEAEDLENADPQMLDIHIQSARSLSRADGTREPKRFIKTRGTSKSKISSYAKRSIYGNKQRSKERSSSIGRKDSYDPNLDNIKSHPLYKEEANKGKKKSKRKGKVTLLKNSARDKLRQELENEPLQDERGRNSELRHEDNQISATRQLELKDDEINKHKSEIDVLNITIKHLHEVLKEKTSLTMEQQREIIALNQRINELSFENTQLKAQNSIMVGRRHAEEASRLESQEFSHLNNDGHRLNFEEKKTFNDIDKNEKLRLMQETETLLNRSREDSARDFPLSDDRVNHQPINLVSSNYLLERNHGSLDYHGENMARQNEIYKEYERNPGPSCGYLDDNLGHMRTDPIIVEENLNESGTISLDPANI
ncbi:unnamed protein product [Moneuplotes crassus]|uniref:DUF4485 domain-containing protein n=1 Tax=Euplotes crassus TaxID=5936 RepID=A0AAD1XCN9_EUPCR|nr:unnamed protein product [Moneuplotes crassus]